MRFTTKIGHASQTRARAGDVSGYTIKQIEDVLGDTSSWKEWQNNIIKNYDNDTSKHVEELFDNWTR